MRSLIVENDALLSRAIKSALKSFGECKEASDRETAILIFEESLTSGHSFDLVTVDMTMQSQPETSISIIKEIRRIEGKHQVAPDQNTCIIVIATTSKRQLVTDCVLDGCDGFLDQNLEANQIIEKLRELSLVSSHQESERDDSADISGEQLIKKVTNMLYRGEGSLPPAPKIAMRIRQLVSSNADIEAIEDLLKHDLSISSRLIKLSNSVAYGGIRKNSSVGQAVRRLGTCRTLEAVLSICCRGYFVTNHPLYKQHVEGLWWHSLACAHLTDMILEIQRLTIHEDLFSLGLLHDIGKLIMIQAAGDFQRPKQPNLVIDSDNLIAMVNAHHRQFGAKLLEKWGYAKDFATLIQTDRPSSKLASSTVKNILKQADLQAIASGFSDGIENNVGIQDVLENFGISQLVQDELKTRIVSRIKELRYLFG